MAQLAQAITGASDTGEEALSAIDQIGAFFGCPMSDGLQTAAATGDGLAWLDAQLERSFRTLDYYKSIFPTEVSTYE